MVELIISMAVLSLVAITVSILMQSGTKHYSLAKAELDLQMESQTVLAQLNSMIMESDKVEYDAVNHILILYQVEQERVEMPAPSDGSSYERYQTNKTLKDLKLVKFQDSTHNLYLQEESTDIMLPASGGALNYPDNELFSNYVDRFDVSIDGSNVTVNLGMAAQKRHYEASVTTKVRNGLITYP